MAAILLLILSNAQGGKKAITKPRTDSIVLDQSYLEAFEPGDIILCKGDSWLSGIIARALPNPYKVSHGGILVHKAGKWQVIHSVSGLISDSDGVRMDSLERFLAAAAGGVALHISPLFAIDREVLQNRAEYYWEKETPFDNDYDLNTRDKLYCTELIRAVYLDAGAEDIFSQKRVGDKEILDFSGFFDERYWSCAFRGVR